MQATGDWRHRLDLITEFANMNTSSASPTEQLLPAKDVIRANLPKDGKRLGADGRLRVVNDRCCGNTPFGLQWRI